MSVVVTMFGSFRYTKLIYLMKTSTLLRFSMFAAGLFFAANVTAQMVGGSVFLKGRYVEAGICDNGDFGAASPPAGYHPHLTFSGGGAKLGFVADPAMDGWAVGTPAYMGDYFVPGSPFEGWNIQIGPIRSYAHSCMGYTTVGGGTLTGANVSYTTSGSEVVGVWEGSFDSMTVRQETTLDTNALFFTMKVTLINNASVAKDDIYYLRSVDPDNNQTWVGGSFVTNNVITYQLPNVHDATVVTANSFSGPASSLSLGTADTNARCMIYSAWPISGTTDMSDLFAGTATTIGTSHYAAGATYNADVAIGLVFRVAHLAPVDSASDSVAYRTTSAVRMRPANQSSFTYFYAFSDDAVDSALNYIKIKNAMDTIADVEVVDTTTTYVKAINSRGSIKAYPNPAGEVLNVTGLTASDHVLLFDMMGRNVSQNWTVRDNKVNTFTMQDLPTGNYILMVKDEHGRTRANVPLRKQ